MPDPLLPAGDTAVGCDTALKALKRARRVTFFPAPTRCRRSSPKREEVRAVIESARSAPDPVVITVRFEGPDLILRTLEVLPTRRGLPALRD